MRKVSSRERKPEVFAEALEQLTRKRSGTVTLTESATTTTVNDPTVTRDSVIVLMPKTPNAAAALGTTSIVPANGSFVITHANNAQTDRDYAWAAVGD